MKNHKDEIWSCDFLVQHTALFKRHSAAFDASVLCEISIMMKI